MDILFDRWVCSEGVPWAQSDVYNQMVHEYTNNQLRFHRFSHNLWANDKQR